VARHRGVEMSSDEVASLLEEQRTITLATIGPDGLPHLAAMWFVPDGDDLLLWTYATSQKARNVARDPRASVLAETGTAYDELRGVCLDCAVEVITELDDVLPIGRALMVRNLGLDPDAPGAEQGLRAQAGKRVGLRLHPVRSRSWDHRKQRSVAGAQ
jgi:PPOX class probable F420-dependent enzyme